MPPEDRFVCRFAAEPPQEGLPSGRWEQRLREEFLGACLGFDDDIGEVGDLNYHPDRTWAGRTYVGVTARTSSGLDVFGFVSYTPADGDAHPEPTDFFATADFTDETAEANPDWKLDLCDEVIGGWRGEHGKVAAMTLVWGTALTGGGHTVTAELAGLTTDQCGLLDNRFALIAPDNYKGDLLEIHLWDSRGTELARESLYEED